VGGRVGWCVGGWGCVGVLCDLVLAAATGVCVRLYTYAPTIADVCIHVCGRAAPVADVVHGVAVVDGVEDLAHEDRRVALRVVALAGLGLCVRVHAHTHAHVTEKTAHRRGRQIYTGHTPGAQVG
jgi:hypothetical protein